eukprot:GHVT01075538.1.p1 GENE.GHVT01075538.1~~GHVT01075538.1.p1  ORF type:complete len:130 (-),score=13.05 GHVT01075538.1:730-1119(-)
MRNLINPILLRLPSVPLLTNFKTAAPLRKLDAEPAVATPKTNAPPGPTPIVGFFRAARPRVAAGLWWHSGPKLLSMRYGAHHRAQPTILPGHVAITTKDTPPHALPPTPLLAFLCPPPRLGKLHLVAIA